MKKLLITLLAVAMVIAMVPGMAFATEGESMETLTSETVGTQDNPVIVNNAETLKNALLDSGAAGAGNTFISITEDINMTGIEWTPVYVNGYNGADVITIEGNNKKIEGLSAPLFAGGFAGGSGIVIKNLTIADSKIVSSNGQGSGAFIECADSMEVITLTNCHLKNSTVTGSRTGGLIGWTSGYSNQNDGPVKTYVTVSGCSVVDCDIIASGTAAAINGHAGASDWTYTTIENCTVTDCNINSTDDGEWRVGVVVGTANSGQVTINNITESGNTITQTGRTAPEGQSSLYGRAVVNSKGSLCIDGKTIAIGGNMKVKCGDTFYETLAEAITNVTDGGTITLLDDITFDENTCYNNNGWYEGVYYEGDKSFKVNLNGKTITNDSFVNDYLILLKNNGSKANVITFTNGTIEAASSAYAAICTSTTSEQQITINLENVNVNGNNSNGSVVKIRGGAVLNVNDGTIITGKDSYLGIEVYAATINIYDGAEIYQNGATSYNGCLMGVGGNGVANVYGGYGAGTKGGLIAMTSGGTINVSDGEWIANVDNAGGTNGNEIAVLLAQSSGGAKCTVNVSGGTFAGEYNCYGDAVGDAQINISSGKFTTDPKDYVVEGSTIAPVDADGYYVVHVHEVKSVGEVKPTYSATGMKAHHKCYGCGKLYSDAAGTTEVSAESLVIPKLVYVPDPTPVTPAPETPKDDVVTNETTNTGAAGETVVTPTTNANVSASTTTTTTETGAAKTETTVEQTTADKIVESAVANKSEEVVIDATTTPAPTTGTTGTTTTAPETTEAAVTIPTATIETIAEQTEAAVTIKTDVAEIKLDNTAAAAIAEQAAEDGTISIVAVKTDEKVVEEETATGETEKVTEVHFELKVVCSERGVIGDFKGGEVTVTVPVPEDMHTEELVAVYIDAQGHYHRVTGVKNANGTFTFTTDHFSSYAVMTAEEAEKAIAEQKAKVESVKLKLRSANSKTSKGKKAIKLTVSEVTDTGIDFDGYVIYRSTKKTSGFKKIYTTKTGTYYNTSAKKGVKYYYKAKGFVTIDGEKVYTDWSLKAIRTAK